MPKSNDPTFTAQRQNLQALLAAGTTELEQHHPVAALDFLKEATQATMVLLDHLSEAQATTETPASSDDAARRVG